MTSWTDFNDAPNDTNLIPAGTLAKVRLTIRPGGHDDPSEGWTGGWATQGRSTGSVYLDCEFVVVEGEYARRKLWSKIGLYSPNGPRWATMGRSLVKQILNSVHGLSDKDMSPDAQARRRIRGLGDLDGLEFVARIGIGKDINGEPTNEVKAAVTRDHADYAAIMVSPMPAHHAPPMVQSPAAAPQQARYSAPPSPPQAPPAPPQPPSQQPAPSQQQANPARPNRPSWAQ